MARESPRGARRVLGAVRVGREITAGRAPPPPRGAVGACEDLGTPVYRAAAASGLASVVARQFSAASASRRAGRRRKGCPRTHSPVSAATAAQAWHTCGAEGVQRRPGDDLNTRPRVGAAPERISRGPDS